MSAQTRLFVTFEKSIAEAVYDRFEIAFEDDGNGISIFETFEDSGVFDVSIYTYTDNTLMQIVRERVNVILAEMALTAVIHRDDIEDIDWVTKSLEGLKPVYAGRFVVHGEHDRQHLKPGPINIEINAGQAFGTGHHGTTAGCLIMIDEIITRRAPKLTLDLGTGSAVLAIAVAKRARTPVLATDIDPVATKVAAQNCKLNEVGSFVHCITAQGFAHATIDQNSPFELIIANILAKPLMKMAPDISRHLAPGGDVVLSGILSQQRWRVLAAFRQAGLFHVKTLWREGWVTLHLTRSGA